MLLVEHHGRKIVPLDHYRDAGLIGSVRET